jgi:hypothetical protein
MSNETWPLNIGQIVQLPARNGGAGPVVGFGRSSRHPWNVYYVRALTGNQISLKQSIPALGLHAGESITVVEIHPDRIVPVKEAL